MSTLKKLRDRLFQTLGFGKSTIGATLTTIDPRDKYPVFIANEGLGGVHVYDTLDELATTIPVSRMQQGMLAVVNQHTATDGTIIPRTVYALAKLPTSGDFIASTAGYNISDYWKPFEAKASAEGIGEIQYAPNVDKVSGVAVLSGGTTPPFPGSRHGRAVTRSQYDILTEGNPVTFGDGVSPSVVTGYWSTTYDATKGHEWMRTKVGAGQWSNPVKVAGEGAGEGDYLDNRFQWSATIPSTPPMHIGGRLNNDPVGWTDTPGAKVDGSKLWTIKARKDVYQQLETVWSTPIEIKIDGTLVRYSERPVPNPNDYGSDYTALTTAGWVELYDPAVHKFMARRESTTAQWEVTKLTGESGEYLVYVFKAFKSDLVDTILNNPSSYKPTNTVATGWLASPKAVAADETLFVSTAHKFSNGELKDTWSDPIPFGGQDSVIDLIKSSGGDDFKKDKAGVVTPTSITLTAEIYKGVTKVTPTSITWKKVYNNGAVVDVALGTTASIVVNSADVTGKAIFRATQVFEGRTYNEEYSILDVTDGIDAKHLITNANTNTIIVKTDGSRVPSTAFVRAYSQNLSGPIHWYKNGVLLTDGTGAPKVFTNDTISLDLTEFTSGTEITYKAVCTADGLEDSTTFYGLAEAAGGAPAVTMVLSNESHTLVLDEATGTTNYSTASTGVRIFEGATEVTSTWTVSISGTTNTTAVLGGTASAPTVSVTKLDDGFNTGSVTVRAVKGTSTIYKQFSIARIGDPIGSIILDIDSDVAGYTFSPTEQRTKTLTAKLYVEGALTTTGVTYSWSVDGKTSRLVNGVDTVYSTSNSLQVSPSMVEYMATIKCVATYTGKNYNRTVNITDVKDARGIGILYSASTLATLQASNYPDPAWAYDSTGGLRDGVSWSKDATNAIWMSIKKEGPSETWSVPVRIKGDPGKDGIFSASDFWDGPAVSYSGSTGAPDHYSYHVVLRKTKGGQVYCSARSYKGGNTSLNWIAVTIDPKFLPYNGWNVQNRGSRDYAFIHGHLNKEDGSIAPGGPAIIRHETDGAVRIHLPLGYPWLFTGTTVWTTASTFA